MTAADGAAVNDVTALKRMQRTKRVKGPSVTLCDFAGKHRHLWMIAFEGLLTQMKT